MKNQRTEPGIVLPGNAPNFIANIHEISKQKNKKNSVAAYMVNRFVPKPILMIVNPKMTIGVHF